MNTRLQVEHPVTEAITGYDLVEMQLHVAAGSPMPLKQKDLGIFGHAVEARIYAEDVSRGFLPATGTLHHLSFPSEVRVDTGVRQGDTITPHYDPMIAKVIVLDETREAALAGLHVALDSIRIAGTVTNVPFLSALVSHESFAAGEVDTGLIERDFEALTTKAEPSPAVAALAALSALGLPPESGDDPWQALTGWRAWGSAEQSTTLERDGERIEARVSIEGSLSYRVTIGSDTTPIRLHDKEARGMVEINGHGKRADIIKHPGGVTIFMDGADHRFGFPDPIALTSEEVGGDTVMAPMPGVVKSVSAKVGQLVTAGDPLLVLEAMKMEYTLDAPRDGAIAEVPFAVGEQVEDGAIMIVLEAEKA